MQAGGNAVHAGKSGHETQHNTSQQSMQILPRYNDLSVCMLQNSWPSNSSSWIGSFWYGGSGSGSFWRQQNFLQSPQGKAPRCMTRVCA